MEPLRDLAIVLRSVPFGERDRVVTALTENHGQISALAKNSIQSRRFGGALAPFTAAEWLFTLKPGSELYQLSEAHVREAFEGLRKTFERLSLASVLTELMLKMAPQHSPSEELFRLHSNALAVLNDPTTPAEAEIPILNAYLGKLLQWSGNQPRLHSCLHCGVEHQTLAPLTPLSCVITDAGWTCPTCRINEGRNLQLRHGSHFQYIHLRVTPLALQDLHTSLSIPIRKIPAVLKAPLQQHRELFLFLEALLVFHIPGFDKQPLKGLRFLGLASSTELIESPR